jgi:hypothetical protein
LKRALLGHSPSRTPRIIRHARNIEMSNVEVETATADARAAFWLQDVEGADFSRMCFPPGLA